MSKLFLSADPGLGCEYVYFTIKLLSRILSHLMPALFLEPEPTRPLEPGACD